MGRKEKWIPYMLITPALLFMLLVIAYPIAHSVGMSFQEMVLFNPKGTHFIGLDNYKAIFQDEIFWQSLRNLIIWVGFGVFFQFFIGFILALILNRPFKGRGIARSIALIPWVTPGVLIGLMWRWMYDGNYGVINDLLQKVGIIDKFVPWLSSSKTALPAVIVTIIWQGIPFFALMILAGLQSISPEMYEAADVDGATGWQRLIYITLPGLKSTMLSTTLLRIIWVANSIDVVYTMTGGGPGYSTHTLSIYTFVKAQKALDFGYASALSIVFALILSIVAVFYLIAIKKEEEGRL